MKNMAPFVFYNCKISLIKIFFDEKIYIPVISIR